MTINRYSLFNREVRRWRCTKDIFREQQHLHHALDERTTARMFAELATPLLCLCGQPLVALTPEAPEPWAYPWPCRYETVPVSTLQPGDVVEGDNGDMVDQDRVIEITRNADGSTTLRYDRSKELHTFGPGYLLQKVCQSK